LIGSFISGLLDKHFELNGWVEEKKKLQKGEKGGKRNRGNAESFIKVLKRGAEGNGVRTNCALVTVVSKCHSGDGRRRASRSRRKRKK